MDREFWLKRWQANEIGFHQNEPQAPLMRNWTKLNVPKAATVFVPLAGKSLDMVWFAEQGHKVLANELSRLAVETFFTERGLKPSIREHENFLIYSAGVYEIWCGDFFLLQAEMIATAAAVYDRAALVAMPPEKQDAYVRKLAALVQPGTPALLIGLDYDQGEIAGPPFAIPQTRVRELLEHDFSVEVLETRDGLARSAHLKNRGVTRLEETAYLLRRKS